MKENPDKNSTVERAASIFAADAAMQYESAGDFDELLGAFRREHGAGGPTSEHLLFNAAMAAWHKRRLARTETGLYDALVEEVCWSQKNFKHYNPPLKGTAREMRQWETGILGRAFRRDAFDGNAISKIIRAATTVDGMFYKALAEIKGRKTPGKLKAA